MKLFGMTPAEARIARAVASGVRMEEYAKDEGLTQNTAKTHLQSAFKKVGVARQADLVRVLQAIPVVRSVSPCAGVISEQLQHPKIALALQEQNLVNISEQIRMYCAHLASPPAPLK